MAAKKRLTKKTVALPLGEVNGTDHHVAQSGQPNTALGSHSVMIGT
jgi:hypothetical protein